MCVNFVNRCKAITEKMKPTDRNNTTRESTLNPLASYVYNFKIELEDPP